MSPLGEAGMGGRGACQQQAGRWPVARAGVVEGWSWGTVVQNAGARSLELAYLKILQQNRLVSLQHKIYLPEKDIRHYHLEGPITMSIFYDIAPTFFGQLKKWKKIQSSLYIDSWEEFIANCYPDVNTPFLCKRAY